MTKQYNSGEIRRFFRLWNIELRAVLRESIAAQLGYRPLKSGFARLPLTREQELTRLLRQRFRINSFRKSFVSMCSRAGVHLGDRDHEVSLMPLEAVQSSLKFESDLNLIAKNLDRQIQKLRGGKSQRWRRRIPMPVAFELARAIYFCSRNDEAIRVFKAQLVHRGHLQGEISAAHLWVKSALTEWILGQLSALRIKERHAHGTKKLQYRAEIDGLLFDREMVTKLNFSWTFLGSRSHDMNWISHLNEHLIRTILSEGSPRMVKVLGRKNTKKMALEKDMEQRNQETMASGA